MLHDYDQKTPIQEKNIEIVRYVSNLIYELVITLQNSIKFQNPHHKIEKFRELISLFQLF